MKKVKVAAIFALTLFSASSFALPKYATLTTYYDAEGNEIGWYYLGCTTGGSNSSGQTTGYASSVKEIIINVLVKF